MVDAAAAAATRFVHSLRENWNMSLVLVDIKQGSYSNLYTDQGATQKLLPSWPFIEYK